MLMTTMSVHSPVGKIPVGPARFGALLPGTGAATQPPEVLTPLVGMPDGFGSKIYMAENPEQKTLTFYVRTAPHLRATYETSQEKYCQKLRLLVPDQTIAWKWFEDRPVNAVVAVVA